MWKDRYVNVYQAVFFFVMASLDFNDLAQDELFRIMTGWWFQTWLLFSPEIVIGPRTSAAWWFQTSLIFHNNPQYIWDVIQNPLTNSYHIFQKG